MTVLRRGHHPHRVLCRTSPEFLSTQITDNCVPSSGADGQPDTIAPDHRRGPGFARQAASSRPRSPVRSTGQAAPRTRISLVGRAAIAGPVFLRRAADNDIAVNQIPDSRTVRSPLQHPPAASQLVLIRKNSPHLERQPEATKNARYFVAVRCEEMLLGESGDRKWDSRPEGATTR